jgi:hypothetical protein
MQFIDQTSVVQFHLEREREREREKLGSEYIRAKEQSVLKIILCPRQTLVPGRLTYDSEGYFIR